MLRIVIVTAGVLYVGLVVTVAVAQRSLLYFPTHYDVKGPLEPWRQGDQVIGFAREVAAPRQVWLVLHGNGGQAAHRSYLLDRVADDAALFVLEYPGYGDRPGRPSRTAFDAAATEAWAALRARYPGVPAGVIGESIGSGPASVLATAPEPPNKIVLLTPFGRLVDVAREKFRWLPVGWLLRDRWDNAAALQSFRGRVEIYGARDDVVIPIRHARALHAAVPGSQWIEMPGGHNDWRFEGRFTLP